MVFKAAAQTLKQIEDLKLKVQKRSDLLVDTQAWTNQQHLQSVCHQALLQDLEYSLDKKVEQDLWNIGFKTYIAYLQEITRDKKNSRRSEAQILLSWSLEAASGFYLTLLHELCNTFDIDLPFRRRGTIYGQLNSSEFSLPQSSSCLYICQYCLVHLGDIARYRNQRKEAENFYKQAIQVSPTSGHPYNQLALLEASQGNKLSTVFYYIRSITVKNPFPASTTNLMSTLNSVIEKDNPLDQVQRKLTTNEFINVFLTTHAFLHTATDLNQAEIGVQTLNTTMTALVATQSFTSEKLVKMSAINLYALKHVISTCKSDELTQDEHKIRQLVLELLAGSLSAFLVPVHTLKNDETLLDYYALPAVKLLVYWIKNESKILQNEVFCKRLQIWPSLCKLINNTEEFLTKLDYKKYTKYPLMEDRFLQGFRPLARSFKEFDFKNADSLEVHVENLIRVKRLTEFATFLTTLDVNNSKLIVKNEKGFEPGCSQPDPTNELLEEMKSINIADIAPKIIKKCLEKRGGILKPQGSLEKSREERDQISQEQILEPINTVLLAKKQDSINKQKRSKQNVALQSIFKKLEENKQVKFNVDDSEKEPEVPVSFEPNASSISHFTQRPFQQNTPNFPIDYSNRKKSIPPGVNYQFPDAPPPPDPINNFPPYPNFNKPPFNQMPPPTGFNQPPPPHNRFFNPNHMPNNPTAQWWPNAQPNFPPRPDNFHFNAFGNGPFMPSQSDFDKGHKPHSGGDVFNSPWSAPNWSQFGRSTYPEGNNAMQRSPDRTPNSEHLHRNVQDYSLFNTNNMWTPNLVGQLRNKPQDLGQQQSLFSETGPKSLAQLLEQQQLQKNAP